MHIAVKKFMVSTTGKDSREDRGFPCRLKRGVLRHFLPLGGMIIPLRGDN
jgi:hypothetical protein